VLIVNVPLRFTPEALAPVTSPAIVSSKPFMSN